MSKKQSVQKQFSNHAVNYVTDATFRSGPLLEQLVNHVQPQPDWRVLDIATGGGHTARRLASIVQQIYATDITLDMLYSARQHGTELAALPLHFICCDAESLPFPDNDLHLVTCRFAPHHFPHIEQFTRECFRVLRPGGRLAIIDTAAPDNQKAAHYINHFEMLRDPSHVKNYSQAEWQILFQKSGFKVHHTAIKRLPQSLETWAARMGCSPDDVLRLKVMLLQAPEAIREWYQPQPLAHHQEAIAFSIPVLLTIGEKPA